MQSLLNLDEIEEVATKLISKKCWAYYYSAADDLISKSFNNLVYKQILLRPRVFVDCTRCDTSTTMLGYKVGLPLFVSPAAMARLAHPAGERGIAQGIGSFGAVQIVSNNASMTPEQIVEGSLPGQIFGWQIYVQNDRSKSEAMLARINKMADKYKFIVLTLDAPVPGKREHDERNQDVGASLPVSSGVKTAEEPKRPAGRGPYVNHGASPVDAFEQLVVLRVAPEPLLDQHNRPISQVRQMHGEVHGTGRRARVVRRKRRDNHQHLSLSSGWTALAHA